MKPRSNTHTHIHAFSWKAVISQPLNFSFLFSTKQISLKVHSFWIKCQIINGRNWAFWCVFRNVIDEYNISTGCCAARLILEVFAIDLGN